MTAPFDFMTFGLGRVWVWGGGDGGYPDGLLQVFDVSSTDGCSCASMGNRGRGYGGVGFSGGHAWVTTGSVIWEMSADGQRILWSHGFGRGASPSGVFAVGGRLIVQMGPTSTQQLIPEPSGVGARLGDTGGVSDGTQRVVSVEGSDTLLIANGPDLEQWRSNGTEFVSNAPFDSSVGSAVAMSNGDVVASTIGTESGSAHPAVWLARAAAGGSLCPACVRKIADQASVVSLVANPSGGADFVLDDGTAEHWQP